MRNALLVERINENQNVGSVAHRSHRGRSVGTARFRYRTYAPLVAAALFLSVSAAVAQRLPAGVTPTHYTLWFAPDLDKATFRGRESIAVTLTAPASSITLNAAEIAFGEVRI